MIDPQSGHLFYLTTGGALSLQQEKIGSKKFKSNQKLGLFDMTKGTALVQNTLLHKQDQENRFESDL